MQVTKELIDNDILAMQNQLENLKAQMAQTMGALSTLKGIKEYLEKPDPEPQPEPEPEAPVEVVVDANGKYVEKEAEQV